MQRFTYDLLNDVTEDTETIYSSETVRTMQIPAYANDEQRKELFLKIMESLDDVSFTEQRLHLDVGTDFITLRRELGGGYNADIHSKNSFDIHVGMTGVMNELNNDIDKNSKDNAE